MTYPEHLLPKPDYRIIRWRDDLRRYYLLRTVPSPEVIDPDLGKVRARWFDEISREQFKDYSTNLLSIFTTKDAAIQWIKNERKAYLTGYWMENETVNPPTQDDFIFLQQFGYFFFLIDAIQDFPQPVAVPRLPAYTQTRCYILHTPTRSNFWHFSVKWKVEQEDITAAFTEKERRNLLGLIRSFLAENAIVELPDYVPPTVPEYWYKEP